MPPKAKYLGKQTQEKIHRYKTQKQNIHTKIKNKRYTASLVTREMQIKATMRNHDIPPTRPSTIKQTKTTPKQASLWSRRSWNSTRRPEVQDHTTPLKRAWKFPEKLSVYLQNDLAVLLLGRYSFNSRNLKVYFYSITWMFIAVLFVKAKSEDNSTGELINSGIPIQWKALGSKRKWNTDTW